MVWNGIYRRDIALKVQFPKGLCFEDNYSAGMYLFYAEKVMMLDDALYYYRSNPLGISKSKNIRLLDKALVTAKLISDLRLGKFSDDVCFEKLYNKFAIELFHFIRAGKNCNFRIVCINKDLYSWLLQQLDFRRKSLLRYFCLKYNITISK